MGKFKQINVVVEFSLAVPHGENLSFIVDCLDAKIRTLTIEYASDNNYSSSYPAVSAVTNSGDDPE